MRTFNRPTAAHALLCSALLLGAAAPAIAQQATPAAPPIATVNGVAIPPEALEQAVKQAVAQGNPDSRQLRDTLKNQLIARELFLQEARKKKLDQDAQVRAAIEETQRAAMVQRYLQTELQLQPVTEEAVKAHYERVKAGMGAKEFKLSMIMLNNEQRARDLRTQIGQGKDFAELARQWSLAPTASRGGEFPWVSFKTPAKEGATQGLPLPVAQAVEKLQKGKVSNPIEVQGTWWIVKLDDVRPTAAPTFDQARPGIYRVLQTRELERATSELATRLGKSATIVR